MQQAVLDIFPMPDIELICGDCLEVMPDISDSSVDMVMADPPYGITACKWDSIIPLEPMWKQLSRIIKKNGAIVLTASQPFTTILISGNMGMFKYEWIWDKVQPTGAFTAKKRPMKVHENIIVFYEKQPTYNRQMTNRAQKDLRPHAIKTTKNLNKIEYEYLGGQKKLYSIDWDYSKVNPKTIIQFQKSIKRNKEIKHSTQKPVALMEYLIKTYTNEGDTVLDFCMGSGTTGVACKNLNRNFSGIEKDPESFEMAKLRIGNHDPCRDSR